MYLEIVLTVLQGLFCVINCYPSGAPYQSCADLLPQHHGTTSQPLPSPYTISVNFESYTPQNPLIVSLFGKPPFVAFVLQARRKDTDAPVGEFIRLPANTKYLRCSTEQDSVTHSNPAPRNISQFIWNPPKKDVGEVVFKGSVAQSKSFYYGVLESKPIKFLPASSGGGMAPGQGYGYKNGNNGSGSLRIKESYLFYQLFIFLLFKLSILRT